MFSRIKEKVQEGKKLTTLRLSRTRRNGCKSPRRGRRTQVGSGLLAGLDLPLQDARHPARPLGRSTWAAQPRLRAAEREHRHPSARNLRSRRRRRAKAEPAPERHPAARLEACRQNPAARPPHPPPARSLSGCTRPSPSAPTTKWLPAAASRDLCAFRAPELPRAPRPRARVGRWRRSLAGPRRRRARPLG